uniref:BKRF1 encodes EBNA-1 protein-like n=1 Tax=Oryza sativa subsp. japonica TaxID=39947 RepID=Q69LU5_ORYSJ|nr:BKRF1 encodes EBNA-1 protein-like [Oryza sativa Japonica Group]BAD62085.1 BKRF1 encodes EBNA-1 protein-like [Oryza sativa Japonica Group]
MEIQYELNSDRDPNKSPTGLGGRSDGPAVPRKEATTTAIAPARLHRRLEQYSGGNATGRRRERASDGHRAKRRAGRRRGGGCDAEDGDGTAYRRTTEEGEAAGGGRRHERERTTAGRGGVATGRRGRRLKRENGRRGFHFIGAGRELATGEGGTEAGMAAGGHGRWPGMARLFRAINGAIQGGN